MLDARLFTEPLEEKLLQGDLFRTESAFPKIPWMEAIAGCAIHSGKEEAMWAKPVVNDDCGELPAVVPDQDNPWLRKLLELTVSLVEAADGSYLVSQTLQRGPSDMLSALLGDVRMGLWLYDHPDRVRELLSRCADAFIAVTRAQYAMIPRFHGGWALWNYGLWAPGSVTRLQTDSSVQISSEMYRDFILPHERRIMASFAYCLMDLHSAGTLSHCDALIQEPQLEAISVTLDRYENGPSIEALLPVFRKILETKSLLVYGEVTERELENLVADLPPTGLCINVALET